MVALRRARTSTLEFAAKHGWEEHQVFTDRASSGVGSDRDRLNDLLKQALSPRPPFSILLIDDTSRLSRNLTEAMRLYEKFNFHKLRVIAVSQRINSLNEQSELLTTFHGLMDGMYVRELSKKTHRGLEGKALKGLSTGGCCFGYGTVAVDGGKD